jgi:hypothetical protein
LLRRGDAVHLEVALDHALGAAPLVGLQGEGRRLGQTAEPQTSVIGLSPPMTSMSSFV